MKKVALPDKQEGEKILLLNSYLLNYVVASGGRLRIRADHFLTMSGHSTPTSARQQSEPE